MKLRCIQRLFICTRDFEFLYKNISKPTTFVITFIVLDQEFMYYEACTCIYMHIYLCANDSFEVLTETNFEIASFMIIIFLLVALVPDKHTTSGILNEKQHFCMKFAVETVILDSVTIQNIIIINPLFVFSLTVRRHHQK